jgi:ABC-type nitrate/sulfonate/bicarbonate transport system permease component
VTAALPVALVTDIDQPAPVRTGRLPGPLRRGLVTVVMLVAVPVVWALVAATGKLGPGFIGPWPALRTLVQQWGIIWYNAAPTIAAAVYGAVILLVITAVGLMVVGLMPELTPWLVGVSVVVGSLPLISLTPALSLFFSRGTELIIVVVVLSGLVPVAAMLATCARTAQLGREELGAVYSSSRLRWWQNVGVWRCVPVVDVGLRTMFPACFVGAIVAEWSGAAGERGLGGLMANALFSYQVPLLWATLLLAALVSLALLGVVAALMAPLRRIVR